MRSPGRNTFSFVELNAADTITDFTKGSNGDVLNVQGLFYDNGMLDAFGEGCLLFQKSGANIRVFAEADGAWITRFRWRPCSMFS